MSSELSPIVKMEDCHQPAIGVLCQELSCTLAERYNPKVYSSCLAASYVNFVQAAGAQCVPIALGEKPSYYRDVVARVDGLLLPGGGFPVKGSEAYTPAGQLLLKAVLSRGRSGHVVPVLGICLGFQLMAGYFAEQDRQNQGLSFEILTEVGYINKGWCPLDMTVNTAAACSLTEAELEELKQDSKVYYYHRRAVTVPDFNRWLKKEWSLLAKTLCNSDTEVVTWMESKSKPFFGVLFHPEKIKYESKQTALLKCDEEIKAAEKTSEIIRDVFMREVRKAARPKRERLSTAEMPFIDGFSPTVDPSNYYDSIYFFRRDKDGLPITELFLCLLLIIMFIIYLYFIYTYRDPGFLSHKTYKNMKY